MDDVLKENLKDSATWMRGGYMLLFIVILNVVEVILAPLVLIQFGFALVTRVPNDQLKRLGSSLGMYAKEIIDYLTFSSDERPYPFKPWPDINHQPARDQIGI